MRRYTKTKRRQKRRTRRMKGGSEDLVSVVVPTYNRFQYLLETIKSIKGQTYPSIEIIVVNDKSTQPEYYSHDFGGGVKLINLKQNSKELYGYACAAHVRNEGIKVAKGKWVAFCDDDDVWLPKKLELQIAALKESGCKMSCTDGYTGGGKYNPNHSYKLYNAEFHLAELQEIFQKRGSDLLARGFPKFWNAEFLEIHNCVITSSVVIAKEVLDTIGNFKTLKNGDEDYDCWKRAVKHTDIVYVEPPCFYYDNSHGDGRQYGGGQESYTVYVLWTGTNEMNEIRKDSLESLKQVSECNVVLITPENLPRYIKSDHPLHEAYEYLSQTHKADYLRTYLMHFYGGGYSDIKKTTGSWKASFDELARSDKWICGYAEIDGGVAYEPLKDKWKDLIGNGAYICKPNTPLTNEWYNDMIKLLDRKLEGLKLNPAKSPRNGHNEGGPDSKYPIDWNEMLGRIFHRLIYKYKDHVMNTLPISIFQNYRGGGKKNVALILYGRVNSYEHSLEYLNSIYRNPNFNCKVFCSLNLPKTNKYIQDFCKTFEVADEQLNIESIKIPQSYVDMNENFCGNTPVGDKAPPNKFDGCYSTYSMYYNQNRAFNLVETYMSKYNMNFDVVIVFRADMNPSNNNPKVFPVNDIIKANTVYIPRIDGERTINSSKNTSNCYSHGITTLAAYGNFDTMKKYCSLIKNLTMVDAPEKMLLSHLKEMKLDIERFVHEITNNPQRKDPKYDTM